MLSENKKAIRESKISIIVFSKNYASSRWCLDELVMILECRHTLGHEVLPVYFDVDPSELRMRFEELRRHEERTSKDKIETWRAALREVTALAGMDLQNQADRNEATLIKKIIEVVGDKLNRTILSIPPNLVGMHSRVKNIQLWLDDVSSNVGIIAICGMGGIGKTTAAKFLYNLNFSRFEVSSFIANVRETARQPNGLLHLQRQILGDILKVRKERVNNIDEGTAMIKDAICRKKVFVILDDVDELDQLDALLGMRGLLFPGSKIIITTRRKYLLRDDEFYKVHTLENLSDEESLEMFSWHAFGKFSPNNGYKEVSKRVVSYCGGLPLAIEVLGSYLSGKGLNIWNSQLKKLEVIPNEHILGKLQISFNSLADRHDKHLFLILACFFVGSNKDSTITILDGCGFYTVAGIENLMDRCLISIDESSTLVMHHLLQETGREIVRQESPKEPGKRSILWNHEDALNVIQEKTGTNAIEGLKLDTCLVPLEADAFARMGNLKLLQLNRVHITGSYKNFPSGLRWLCWREFPLESIPNEFPLESLVALEMQYSRLTNVWEGTKFLRWLKILDLSHSYDLVKTPDFSEVPNLEKLLLRDCTSLVEVHESIGRLDTLLLLDLEDCKSLRNLPSSICMLKNLETLIVSGCSNLNG